MKINLLMINLFFVSVSAFANNNVSPIFTPGEKVTIKVSGSCAIMTSVNGCGPEPCTYRVTIIENGIKLNRIKEADLQSGCQDND